MELSLPSLWFPFLWFSSTMVNHCPEGDVLLRYYQKGITSPLRYSAHVIHDPSSHHPGILLSHVITRRKVRTGQEAILGERDHIHMNFIIAY